MTFLPVHEIKFPRKYAKLEQTVDKQSFNFLQQLLVKCVSCCKRINLLFAPERTAADHEIWEVTPLVQIGTGESVEMREHLTSNKHRVQYARQKDLDSK